MILNITKKTQAAMIKFNHQLSEILRLFLMVYDTICHKKTQVALMNLSV